MDLRSATDTFTGWRRFNEFGGFELAIPSTDDLCATALVLYDRGYIPVPLRKSSKHIDMERLGYTPHHLQTKRKKLKELMFDSVCFSLSQNRPEREAVALWFQNFTGNIGVIGGHSGLMVLDFDKEPVFEAWKCAHRQILDAAFLVSSPTGHHVFLNCEVPLASSSLYFGWRKAGHLKSLGGYVATAPSVLGLGRDYRWSAGLPVPQHELPTVGSLDKIGLSQGSIPKQWYDGALGRGMFEPE